MAERLRELVATGCRVLGADDQGDLIWGHISARDPGGRGAWMKASSWGLEEIDAERTLLVDPDGRVLEGSGECHAEYAIHTEILSARQDVHAVVHTHAPHATAFAATGQPLRPLSHEATLFTPPAVPRFEKTADLILTRGLGRMVAEALGASPALFLVNHGIVTVGSSVPIAVMHAVILERACRMQLLAAMAGGAVRWSSDGEALSKRDHCYSDQLLEQAFKYLARRSER